MKYLVATFLIIVFSTLPVRAADEWMSEYRFKSHMKNMKRNNMRPTSVACRKIGEGALKAEVKAHWVPDDGKKEWALYIFRGVMEWRPGEPGQWHKWRRASYSVLKGRGGAKLRCALYEMK